VADDFSVFILKCSGRRLAAGAAYADDLTP
jgi:hypothetical protein